ncbi:hypothetical protein U1Q18_038842 [Sarracenia purpurea var. burkii]
MRSAKTRRVKQSSTHHEISKPDTLQIGLPRPQIRDLQPDRRVRHNHFVEVRRKQEGFYYPVTLFPAIETNQYLVWYQTRFTEDKSRLLTEALDAAGIWSEPSEIQSTSSATGKRIEA